MHNPFANDNDSPEVLDWSAQDGDGGGDYEYYDEQDDQAN